MAQGKKGSSGHTASGNLEQRDGREIIISMEEGRKRKEKDQKEMRFAHFS